MPYVLLRIFRTRIKARPRFVRPPIIVNTAQVQAIILISLLFQTLPLKDLYTPLPTRL